MPVCESGKCTNGPPPVAPRGCDGRAADFDRALASATRKCTTDQDCACFRGGVSKTSRCGGITDAKTNERLEAIAKEWAAAGCTDDDMVCPAIVCEAACNAGTCGPRQLIQ